MFIPKTPQLNRRGFLQTAGLVTMGLSTHWTRAADAPPRPRGPKATSGDAAVEPIWQERLTVTVGAKKGDLIGDSDKVLQAAVDYVTRFGGGTVHVLPGIYTLRNSIYLKSNVRILGSGADSVLVKAPSAAAKLALDSDWYDQEITVDDDKGFKVGDGVCLRATGSGGTGVVKRTLIARDGKRFKLDRAPRQNFWIGGQATAATLFPIISGEEIADVAIENITLDGNRANNANLDGNYAGCIWLQDCSRIKIAGVTARNYNGDGISWQICHDVAIERCHSHDNAQLGLHPGSGSQRPIIRNNKIERNDIGIFFCWGVKNGIAENNVIRQAGSYGVSIGHCDTDNIVRSNRIIESGKVGVLFRNERRNFAGHRNLIEKNKIENSGPETGVAIDVQGQTDDVVLAQNIIRETRGSAKRIAIRIGAEAGKVDLNANTIDGFDTPIVDLRRSTAKAGT